MWLFWRILWQMLKEYSLAMFGSATELPLIKFADMSTKLEVIEDSLSFWYYKRGAGATLPNWCLWTCTPQGCDCAANRLILANSDPNVCHLWDQCKPSEKMFPLSGVGGLCCSGTAFQMFRLQDVSAHFSQFRVGSVSSLTPAVCKYGFTFELGFKAYLVGFGFSPEKSKSGFRK